MTPTGKSSKLIDSQGLDVEEDYLDRAPVTRTVVTVVILSVLQSFNFGFAIGMPNNTQVMMQEVCTRSFYIDKLVSVNGVW